MHCEPLVQAEVIVIGHSPGVSPSTRPPQWRERRATRPKPKAASEMGRERMRLGTAMAVPRGLASKSLKLKSNAECLAVPHRAATVDAV